MIKGKDFLFKNPTDSPFVPASILKKKLGGKELLLMGANENLLGPSPKALRAIAESISEAHRYPDGSNFELRERIAKHLDVPADYIVVEAGISGILRVAVEAFVKPREQVVYPWPSYASYPLIVRAAGGIPISVPLSSDLTTDFEAILEAAQSARMIWLCNPNNPTGMKFTNEPIRWLVNRLPSSCLLMIDEAYIEYSEWQGVLPLIREGYPIVAMRTFSKVYGLAGLRIGYAVMNPELADWFNRCREPIMVSSISKTAAMAALDDKKYLQCSIKAVQQGLKEIEQGCLKLGIEVVPSKANFVLLRFKSDARKLEFALLQRGIMVRATDGLFDLPGGLRVTVGTSDMNQRFLYELSRIIS